MTASVLGKTYVGLMLLEKLALDTIENAFSFFHLNQFMRPFGMTN